MYPTHARPFHAPLMLRILWGARAWCGLWGVVRGTEDPRGEGEREEHMHEGGETRGMERALFSSREDATRQSTLGREERKVVAGVVNLEFVVQEHLAGLHQAASLASLADINQRNLDIKSLLKQLHSRLKDLEQLAMSQDSEREKAILMEHVKTHQTEYNNFHLALRKVNMICNAAREKRHATARAELLEGSEAEMRRRKERAAGEAAKAQESITATLRRTRQKMYDEALRGAETIQSLRESSDTLNATLHQQKNYGASVRTAHGLLTKLRRRECTDMLLVLFGVFFFFSVVLYICLDRLGFLSGAPR